MFRALPPSSPLATVYARSHPRGAELRQRLKAWGEGVAPRLSALGLNVDRCAIEGGRAIFQPDGRLSLTANAAGLEVALELSRGDVVGARTRLADGARSELMTCVDCLPEQFELRTGRGRARSSTSAAAEMLALFEPRDVRRPDRREGADANTDEADGEDERTVWLGWRVPRDVAVAHAAVLDEQLEDAVVLLAGLLARIVGARAPAAAATPAEPRLKRHRVPAPARPAAGRKNAAAAVIEKGAHVRVLDGPFAGKVGTVRELDGKGGARVMMGLFAVHLDLSNLATSTEGRARPRLTSSHRKPIPVRS
jgi:hypothetical protein